ncbi:AAA family ATPase [Gynuella sunshinyii]|uniref:Putative ATPase n=1 Tax=Gynuella sunshinyii YC6258 TaxID=1445510 RepID=A0A0C5VWR1_9GAMM|nr:AAA family ATPase [Gynuella sunshinyii]AJQ94879.1 putative ATPase [Gynuella sunshinyii YC6258]
MEFKIIKTNEKIPEMGRNVGYLKIDRWNDYSFVTMFYLSLHDEKGELHKIGDVKVAFKKQSERTCTYDTIGESFTELKETYFSLGQRVSYYKNLSLLSLELRNSVLLSLRDIVFKPAIIEEVKDEEVFKVSLLRNISLSEIKGQFSRVLEGKPPLTNFEFSFERPKEEKISGIDLDFRVKASSSPSTNIHAIIGRNGVGKTTILNDMIKAVMAPGDTAASFSEEKTPRKKSAISKDYFSSLVSVSFSAFDPFSPPREQSDPSKGTCYFYIGLKDREDQDRLRTISELQGDCCQALTECFRSEEKRKRWHAAIRKLGSDENFERMKLEKLENHYKSIINEIGAGVQSDSDQFKIVYLDKVRTYLDRMSSGHAVVLLTITRLVATVEEKTLVLIDEPESHLHPPLLSAFIRALSDLLHDRNGVAIIATHSPVVLQEIPKSCVWTINRVGVYTSPKRPDIETFGENVGVLTREIFGLEVVRSGFYDLLVHIVEQGKSYEEILREFNSQLGFEGRAILKALISNREGTNQNDADK